MRVYVRYGKGMIDLGEMSILPEREDRVWFRVPGDLRQDADDECLTVGRRIFEQRERPGSLDDGLEWVCILTFQETR